MRQPFRRSAIAAALAAIVPLPGPAAEPSPQVVPVHVLAFAPKTDGDLSEWGNDGWVAVPVKPALERKDRPAYGLEESDDRNATGSLTVQLKAGVAGGRLFLAVRYPDATEDRAHQGWEWRGTRYALARRLADQFAVRFHLDGDFDRTMLSAKDYSADVWLWNAARTDFRM